MKYVPIIVLAMIAVFALGLTPVNKGYYYPGNPAYGESGQPAERPSVQLPQIPYSQPLWNLGYLLRGALGSVNMMQIVIVVGLVAYTVMRRR